MEAAGRLLREAIHLFFEQRDELVIHVVGSAAYGILKDLTEHKGRNQAAEVEFSGLFYPIRDYHRGILPSSFQNNPDLMKFIKELAQKYPAIKVSHEFKDFEISMDSTDTRRYWNKHNKVASFLKHANRDPDDRLDMDNVNNLFLLNSACTSCAGLGKILEPEFDVLMIYTAVELGTSDILEEALYREISEFIINKVSSEERLEVCRSLLTNLLDSLNHRDLRIERQPRQ